MAAELEGTKVAEFRGNHTGDSETWNIGSGWIEPSSIGFGSWELTDDGDDLDFSRSHSNTRLRVPLLRPEGNVQGLYVTLSLAEELATLDGNWTIGGTTLTVNTAPDPEFAVNQKLRIFNEIIRVSSGSGTSYTVVRGVDDTTASAHLHDTGIFSFDHQIETDVFIPWGNTTRDRALTNENSLYPLSVSSEGQIGLQYYEEADTHDRAGLAIRFYRPTTVPPHTLLQVYIAQIANNLGTAIHEYLTAGSNITLTTLSSGEVQISAGITAGSIADSSVTTAKLAARRCDERQSCGRCNKYRTVSGWRSRC